MLVTLRPVHLLRLTESPSEKTGCRGWNRTSIRAFKGRCPTIRRPGKWWPARVTRPVLRIKSPLHHFNACEPGVVLVAGFAPALATFSTSCLCLLGYTSQRKSIPGRSLPPTQCLGENEGHLIYFALGDVKWPGGHSLTGEGCYARPVTLRNPALI